METEPTTNPRGSEHNGAVNRSTPVQERMWQANEDGFVVHKETATGHTIPAVHDRMEEWSMQSHRDSDIEMLPVVSLMAGESQKRHTAVGARWDVSNLQRALEQLRVEALGK